MPLGLVVSYPRGLDKQVCSPERDCLEKSLVYSINVGSMAFAHDIALYPREEIQSHAYVHPSKLENSFMDSAQGVRDTSLRNCGVLRIQCVWRLDGPFVWRCENMSHGR